MSKPVKNMIIEMYREQFRDVTGAVLVDIRGVTSNDNMKLRANLAKKGIRVTVVKNTLARLAFEQLGLASSSTLLQGPSALVYGSDSVVNVARELLDIVKTFDKLQLKGAVMDGQIFAANEVDALSKYPTREEAQAQVIQVILGPAGQVIGAAVGIGGQIASIIKQVEEKLEKGETITKVA
jgi:large subunit ribosomal protein L10